MLQAAAVNTDTPIIVVLIHGGPLDVSWLEESPRVDAILSAWHPGQVRFPYVLLTAGVKKHAHADCASSTRHNLSQRKLAEALHSEWCRAVTTQMYFARAFFYGTCCTGSLCTNLCNEPRLTSSCLASSI